MDQWIAFCNAFLSYLLLFLLCVAVVALACFLGIRLRKRRDRKKAEQEP